MCKASAILVLLFLSMAHSAGAAPQHPLDGLEADEIIRAAAILRDANHTDDSTAILALTLEPPPKSAVLAWSPGQEITRAARATVRRDRINREIVIDLDEGRIASVTEIPGPGQPPLILDELFAAIDATLRNEETPVASSVGLSVLRFGAYLRAR